MPIALQSLEKKKVPEKRVKIKQGKRVTSKDIAFFLTQLSMLLEVGISLSKAIDTISKQVRNSKFQQVMTEMVNDIEAGKQLSDAMAVHPQVFKPLYVNMVRSGELGGSLTLVIGNIIEIQDKNQGVLNQIKAALIYPVILCVMAVVVTIFVLIGILPKFMVFFQNKMDVLPFTTRTLMGLSYLLTNYWWMFIIVAAGIGTAVYLYWVSSAGRSHRDWLLIHTPVISRVSNNIYTGLFLNIVGNMLNSGVPLKDALLISSKSMENRYYKRFVEKLHQNIEQGMKLSTGILENPHIQDSVKQVIFVGEEVGKLPMVMMRLVKFYDTEIEQDFKKMTALIEPLALIFMGIAVWMIVSAVILPMFRLASAIN
jgi:type IV pilus assembly protein PilC